ncbi:hypothetical protein PIROE2DRAFT_10431 [Piromyces sp. E2]|nr:hypothetical protein PIROE2DRAFT_10431 [Piromyces sp. E2]|eukprot:OUM63119.1 hypothetical protein PIROE2DRAFT_10431 [Piromyces sp. E2]
MIYFKRKDKTHKLMIQVSKYEVYENTFLTFFDMEEGPFCRITVNIIPFNDPALACIDTNNHPFLEDIIKEYDLGEPIGISIPSGFCRYPVYRFNLTQIEKHKTNIKFP